MGLRGQFSNLPRPFSDLPSHTLTGLDGDQDLQNVKTTAGWPDGRRKLGTVSAAIVEVLAHSPGEMAVRAIRVEVEA
jgi:hypothetical protein